MGHAHQEGDASGGGGKQGHPCISGKAGHAGNCGWWQASASRGTIKAPMRPNGRCRVVLGDKAPARHHLRDLLLPTMKTGL